MCSKLSFEICSNSFSCSPQANRIMPRRPKCLEYSGGHHILTAWLSALRVHPWAPAWIEWGSRCINLLAWVPAQSLQSCLTLCDPMDCSLPSSSVHGFFRQEYWSGLPFPPPEHLPDPGIKPVSPASPALQADSLPTEPPGKPLVCLGHCKKWLKNRDLSYHNPAGWKSQLKVLAQLILPRRHLSVVCRWLSFPCVPRCSSLGVCLCPNHFFW